MAENESEEDEIRGELVSQLRESLAKSRMMMLDEKLDRKERERWTHIHAYTSQVLNQVLRDRQFKDWETRLREIEARKRRLSASIGKIEGGS